MHPQCIRILNTIKMHPQCIQLMQFTPQFVASLGVFRKELGQRSKGHHKLLPMSWSHSVVLLGPLRLSQILGGALRPEDGLEDLHGQRPPVALIVKTSWESALTMHSTSWRHAAGIPRRMVCGTGSAAVHGTPGTDVSTAE